jgi:hypothetical protein
MDEKLYNEYEKYNFMIANPDIFGFGAVSQVKEFIKKNNISKDRIDEFDERMKKECKDGQHTCKLESFSDIEYITYVAMIGNLSKSWLIRYMTQNKINKIELCNGLIIRQFGENKLNYVVDFLTDYGYDSIKYELFMQINKARC